MTAEHDRLEAARRGQALWKKWGPNLSERQWGNGPRGLQCGRQRLALLQPRPVAFARRSLEQDGSFYDVLRLPDRGAER